MLLIAALGLIVGLATVFFGVSWAVEAYREGELLDLVVFTTLSAFAAINLVWLVLSFVTT